jgi:positive regulator of sigma E activity
MTLKFIGRSVAKSFRRRHEKRPQWTGRIVSQLLMSCQQKSACGRTGAHLGTAANSLSPPERGDGWGEGI